MPKWSGWLIFVLIVACSPQAISTPVPTLTLIPPTITPTETPIVPTITPQNLPEAQDFILTPSPMPLQPVLGEVLTFDIDVIELTRLDLANNIGVPAEALRLAKVTPRLYYAESCPTGQFVVPSALDSGYEVVWIFGDETYTYLTWDETSVVWCKIERLRGEYLTAIDPIAAELSALAIRRVQQLSEATPDEIYLEDVLPFQWQDSSLGCPQDGQTYTPVQIDGYRIIVSDGETSYLFHTDSVQLVSCSFDDATS